MTIAGELCVYTNTRLTTLTLPEPGGEGDTSAD